MEQSLKYKKMFVYEEIFERFHDLQRLESMDYDTRTYAIPDIYKRTIDLVFDRHDLSYADLGGDKELKCAIDRYESRLTETQTKDKMIFVGSGVSSLINPTIEAILNLPENKERKDVILFSPDYPLFHSAVEVAKGNPVVICSRRENNYVPTIAEMSTAITPKTAAILFSNPNNPTGKNYSEQWIRDIVSLSEKYDFFIVSDEVYSHMVYEPHTFVHIASIKKDYRNYIKLFGLSKDRPGMTGMRTGYCIGDKRLLDTIYDIQMVRNFSGNIVSDSIFLTDMALRYFDLSKTKPDWLKYFSEEDIQDYYKTIARNKALQQESIAFVIAELKKNAHVADIIPPDGGNSVFFRYYKTLSSMDLMYEFAHKGLAAYPTDAFNMDPQTEGSWIRICVTKSIDFLKASITKI